MARLTRVLVDASAIIHLSRIGELDLLRELLGTITITAEVADELRDGPTPLDITKAPLDGWVIVLLPLKAMPQLGLGAGETSTLAAARREDRLILDDLQARAIARARGLDYVGILGLLVAAVRRGVVSPQRGLAILDRLVASDFRVSAPLYVRTRELIHLAGRRRSRRERP